MIFSEKEQKCVKCVIFKENCIEICPLKTIFNEKTNSCIEVR